MRYSNFILTLISAVILSGCTYVNNKLDHSDAYKKAQPSINPITVPENLSSQDIENYYPVPDIGAAENNKSSVSLLPPGSSIHK